MTAKKSSLDRRHKVRLLIFIPSVLILAILLSMQTWRGSPLIPSGVDPDQLVDSPFETDERLLPIQAPAGFDWKKYSGLTLNFIIENNLYASILSHKADEFTEATGIRIKIIPLEFSTMIEKLHIDLLSRTGKFQLVYVDPYQTLPSYNDSLVDLNQMITNPELPDLPGGMQDFNELHRMIDSYYQNQDKIFALPFDSPTMLLFYRQDIVANYGPDFIRQTGIDRLPGDEDFTWEDYYQFGAWLNTNLHYQDANYGIGHQAKLHNSLFCDFSNLLSAYGGDYFEAGGIGIMGSDRIATASSIDSQAGISAMDIYRRILSISHPKSTASNWFDLAELFRNGEIAMMPNFNEYLAMVENPDFSKVAGKTGYSILPRGSVRSANHFGGSGIGINAGATIREQEAAWLFLVWVTSPQTELDVFEALDGGDIPIRNSVLDLVSTQDYRTTATTVRAATFDVLAATRQAWSAENLYYRPKTSLWRSMEIAITQNLRDLIKSDIDPASQAKRLARDLDDITGH